VELRAGYKQTQIGIIPKTWEAIALGEIGEPLIGLTYDPEDIRTDGTLVLRSSNIDDGTLRFDDIVCVSSAVPERIMVRKDDILICVRNGSRNLIGKCAILDERAQGMTFGAFMSVLRTPHARFVYHQLQSQVVRKQIDNHLGATINQITNSSLKSFVIPFPDTECERSTIATALSDVDALISSLDKLIAKKRDIKQAAMQQLLTGKRRLPGFCGEWVSRRIGDISDSSSGGTPLSSVSAYYGGSIPWVSISDMTSSGKYLVMTERSLTDEGLAASAAKVFPAGTVLYAMYASIGECSIAAIELCSSQAILGIRPRESCDGHYLYYWLVSKKDEVIAMGQHGTQANLNADMVKDFRVPLPTIDEQRAIANVLSDMDAEIEALERRRDKTRLLKQGMMQELLTGRVRLV